MKILIVYPHAGTERWGLAFFYKEAFAQLGHDVRLMPTNNRPNDIVDAITAKIKRSIQKSIANFYRQYPYMNHGVLIDEAKKFKPQLTIVIRCEYLAPEAISELGNISPMGCVNIYPDHPFVIPGGNAIFLGSALSQYSVIFTFARFLIPVFYQLGAKNVVWLPFGYDPSIHNPVKREGSINIISYLGCWGHLQEQWLEKINIYNPKIYGTGWGNLSKNSKLSLPTPGEGMGPKMADAISRSKLIFNLIRAEHGCAHSMKTFEIPACGGLMLTNRTDEQQSFLTDKRHCIYFENDEELLDLIKYFSMHDTACDSVRLGGMEAVKPHSYQQRAKALLLYLNKGLTVCSN